MKKIFLLLIITLFSLVLLADFTENFDAWSDGSYAGVVEYTHDGIGTWENNNAMVHETYARSGKAVRFNDDSSTIMEYLLFKGLDGNGKDGGLGTISFWYRHWDGNVPSEPIEFIVEYQVGSTSGEWTAIGSSVNVTSTTYTEYSETVNLPGDDIFFRIRNIEDKERLLIDDLTVTDYSGGAVTTPIISGISNTPDTPSPSEDCVISATITDDGSITSVEINWGLTSGSLTNTVSMSLDSGDIYTGTIPAQADGATVYYTVSATDNDTNTETSDERSYNVVLPIVSTPYFTPDGGIYSETQSVEIFCSTVGASIYYTIDGSEPTEASTLYSTAISISETTTVKAKAYLVGYGPSAVAEVLYDFSVAEPANIYISEYIEGSSNNKAIEIYNAGDNDVNLGFVEFWRISNGGDWAEGATNAVTLSGTLAPGEVYVVCNSSAIAEIQALSDLVGTTVCYFNGDDAMGLAYNGTLVDVVGAEGADPGTGWDVAGETAATVDHTLIRKTTGFATTDWLASAGTSATNSQWIVSTIDDYSNLGSPTPGTPDVIISEVCTEALQYIELYNAGTSAQDLTGWSLNQHSPDMTTPLTGTINSGSYLVVIGGTLEDMLTWHPTFAGNYIEASGSAPSMINGSWLDLNNGSSKAIIDQFGSETSGATVGQIYERTDKLAGKDVNTDWTIVPSPTPGEQNNNDYEPTAVEFSSFEASSLTIENTKVVRIEWTVATETAMLGYNLHRAGTDNQNERYIINSNVIASQNSSSHYTYSYDDGESIEPGTFYYWLESLSIDGINHFYGPISVTVKEDEEDPEIPETQLITEINSIFPNPFNPSTAISFSLAKAGNVKITVFNVKGEVVNVIANRYFDASDNNVITWDGNSFNNASCGSGIYFFKVETNGFTATRKAILIK